MDKLQLLESVLGRGSKTNRDYYQFICPFHTGKNGPKLGISLGTGGWKCWVCPSKGRSVSGLFGKLNVSKDKIQLSRQLWIDKVVYQPNEQVELISLPKEFRPLWQPTGSFYYEKAKGYLESRGVTEKEIIKYHLGYCETGKFADMIVFPSFNEDGQLNYYSGRSYLNNPSHKFALPTNIEKDVILYEDQINWQEPVIIVESRLDAIVVRRNSIPNDGKTLNKSLKKKIIEEETPKVIFCLDGDALNDAILQSEYFIQNGVECFKVRLPENEDPSSLGHEKVWQFIDKAERITESEIFKFKLLNRLK